MSKRRSRTISLLLGWVALSIVLAGCWDRLELEERAVVLGVAIDTADPEAEEEESPITHLSGRFPVPDERMIRLTVQIAIPGKIPLGPGEGGGGGKGESGQTVWVIAVTGHTIDDALVNLQQQVSGRLFYGHLRVIVVSEAVAREGMENLNDYLRRNSEVRRMAWMMVSQGKAEDLMKATPQLERVPTLYLISTMDSAVRMGKLPENYIGMFWSNLSKLGQEAFLPYVRMRKEQNIEINGLAYFKGEKMIGKTKPLEIGTYMAIKGLNPAGYRGFVRLERPPGMVTIFATSRRAAMQVRIVDNEPKFTVRMFTEINLEEKLNSDFDVNSSDVLEEIQRENRKQLAKAAKALIEQTQRNGSDIFGFGEYLRAKKPRYWDREVKTPERWQNMYKNVSIEVDVDSRVRRIGMKAN
ncbi:Ger(x)C family spore germination protein [Cohnella massiliensis]|uniref:Ger(x)C family spore germination protein n=1 Tax=Cohnella massiliensis TaxID=1816691 RepID=UPI00111AC2BE|nr:Ger(x)C family spore germination protein [Cohnella massiliensis]